MHPLYLEDLRACVSGADLPRGSVWLVTGASGLIGSTLTDALCRCGADITVIAVGRDERRLRDRFEGCPRVIPFARDISVSAEGLPRADYIVHAASNAHPLAFSQDPVGTMRANLLGTMNLLEHLRGTGGRRLLLCSTGEVYGQRDTPSSESDPGLVDTMDPRSCYPESKRAAETLCAAYVRQYGLEAVIARLCYVYGPAITPENSRADAQFLRRALAGEDIILKSEGTQRRSYCYAADAGNALLTVMLKGSSGEAYNIASRGGEASIREYAETLAGLAGVNVRFELPPEAERQGYSRVTRAVQDPAKLEALGWRAKYTLREGLKRTLAIARGRL